MAESKEPEKKRFSLSINSNVLASLILAAGILGGAFIFKSGSPDLNSPAHISVVAEAKQYRNDIITNYHDSYEQAVKDVRTGRKFGEIQADIAKSLKDKNESAFRLRFNRIVPLMPKDNSEPSVEEREFVAKFLEDVSKGFK